LLKQSDSPKQAQTSPKPTPAPSFKKGSFQNYKQMQQQIEKKKTE